MNILLLSQYFEPHRGGIETVVRNEARVLAAKGHTVTVLSSRLGKEPTQERMDGFRVIRVAALNWPERTTGVPYALFSTRLFRVVRDLVSEADIVHSHGALYLTTIAARRACTRHQKPLVVTEHVSVVPYRNPLLRWMQRIAYRTVGTKSYRMSAAIFALNADIRANIVAHGGAEGKVTLLPNGVDTKLFRPGSATERRALRAEHGLPPKIPIILFVGRFVEKKGFRLLLDSLGDGYLVLCVGEGEVPVAARNDPRVRFLGPRSQRELAPLYRLSDAFILPSHGEGFPAAIQEAMASGLPIITTDNPGYDAYLDRRNSVRIASRTPADVRTAIRAALKDTKHRTAMGVRSVQTARTSFSWDEHVRTLLRTYQKVRA